MKRIFACICVWLLCGAGGGAKEVWLDAPTVAELKQVYARYGYDDWLHVKDWKYPPVFLKHMPKDFKEFAAAEGVEARDRLFMMMLAPMAMKVNQEFLADWEEVWEFKETTGKLSAKQEKRLEELAAKYDVFTRLKGEARIEYLLGELEEKADAVPPSILVGAAALESGWGTSRAVFEGNSLYKDKVWYGTEPGLEPEGEPADKSYKLKIYPSLMESMRAYALKFNSHVNYFQARVMRSEHRYIDKPLLGRDMAHTMVFDSQLPNFSGLLEYTMAYYNMDIWDEATIRSTGD